jgi:hypothetical protein
MGFLQGGGSCPGICGPTRGAGQALSHCDPEPLSPLLGLPRGSCNPPTVTALVAVAAMSVSLSVWSYGQPLETLVIPCVLLQPLVIHTDTKKGLRRDPISLGFLTILVVPRGGA